MRPAGCPQHDRFNTVRRAENTTTATIEALAYARPVARGLDLAKDSMFLYDHPDGEAVLGGSADATFQECPPFWLR